MFTSHSDSNFEQSNIILKENKWDGVALNSNGPDYCIQKNEEKIIWFSEDCVRRQKIKNALRWLIHSNAPYKHIHIDAQAQNSLPENGIPDDLLSVDQMDLLKMWVTLRFLTMQMNFTFLMILNQTMVWFATKIQR